MNTITIEGREIGPGHPAYVIAELSANHGQRLEQALRIVEAAADAGADAIKLQTYTPDTLTIDAANDYFRISGTLWDGRTLHDLYREAFMPWEWHAPLRKAAAGRGLQLFSTPFDHTAVEFLEALEMPAYKIASFEMVDLPLLRRVAATGKPIIMSTGMADLAEIDEAVQTLRAAGAAGLVLLRCNSAYPAPPDEMHLRSIPHLSQAFDVPVGLSDHTLDSAVAVAAVALGACVIEKHLTLARADGGPDSAFSLEPHEFAAMVRDVRTAERALGGVAYAQSPAEAKSRPFRRSLFVVKDVEQGEILTPESVRSIRPGHGLHTRHYDEVVGSRARVKIARGTPVSWDLIEPR